MQFELYQQAAWKAFNGGDRARLEEILNDHLPPAQRASMLAEFERQQLWRAAGEGKLAEALELITRLRSDEERAQALTQLATTAAGKGERQTALRLLDEAHRLLARPAENAGEFHAQLNLARAYAGLEPGRSFELIEPMAEQLNALVAASAVLDGFERRGGFREGELLWQGGGLPLNLLQQFLEQLGVLARADFERAQA